MTVSSQTSRISYTGDGVTTAFPVPYYFLDADNLVVAVVTADGVSTPLVLGTDYSVNGVGNPDGGSVVTAMAVASGSSIIVSRMVSPTQETAYRSNDPFPAKTHERALDKLTMVDQQVEDALGLMPGAATRVLQIPSTDPGMSSRLPTANARAGKAVIFDEEGNPAVSIDNYNDQVANVSAAAGAAISAKDLAVASATNAKTSEDAAQAAYADTHELSESFKLVYDTIGYAPPVPYDAALNMTTATQTVEYGGFVYAPLLDALPFVTSGVFETAKFRLIQGVPDNSVTDAKANSFSTFYVRLNRESATLMDARYGLVDYGDPVKVTKAWNDALEDVRPNRGPVKIPRPPSGFVRWDVDGTILIEDRQRTYADSMTVIRQVGGAKPIFKSLHAGESRITRPQLDNFYLSQLTTEYWQNSANVAIDFSGVSHFHLGNITARDGWYAAIRLGGSPTPTNDGYYNRAGELEIATCLYGIDVQTNGNSSTVADGRIFQCREGIRAVLNSNTRIQIALEQNMIGLHALASAFAFDVFAPRNESNNQSRTPTSVQVVSEVAIVTRALHYMLPGDQIVVRNFSASGLNGLKTVTVLAHNQYSFPAPGVADGSYSVTNVTITLRDGGGILYDKGARGGLVLGGHYSGTADSTVDRDGGNAAIVLGNGHMMATGMALAGTVANGDLRVDSNGDGIADGISISPAPATGFTLALDATVTRGGGTSQRFEVAAAGTSRRDAVIAIRVEKGKPNTIAFIYASDAFDYWNYRLGNTGGGTTYSNGTLDKMYPASFFDDAGITDKSEAFNHVKQTIVPTQDVVYLTLYMNTATAAPAAAKKRLWLAAYDRYPGLFSGVPGSAPRPFLPVYTSAERDAVSMWNPNSTIYNSTTGREEIYLNGTWQPRGIIGAVAAAAQGDSGASTVADLKADFNALLAKMRAAKLLNT